MKKLLTFIMIMAMVVMTACGSAPSTAEAKEDEVKTNEAKPAVTKTAEVPEQTYEKDLNRLLSASDDAVFSMAADFAQVYSGTEVSFKGYVADIDENSDGSTGTILLHSGHYNNPNVHGPDIVFEDVSVSDYENIEGFDVAVTAVIQTYDMDRQLLIMHPKAIAILSKPDLRDIDYNASEVAKLVQTRLNETGFDCGSVDGIIGKNTRSQIAAYRSKRGLSDGEVIDATLLAYMHITPKMVEKAMVTPTPAPTAEPAPETTDLTRQQNVSDSGSNGSGGNSNFNLYNNIEQQNTDDQWVLNTNTRKIHRPSCSSVPKIAKKNCATSNESIEVLKQRGYDPCGNCLKGY